MLLLSCLFVAILPQADLEELQRRRDFTRVSDAPTGREEIRAPGGTVVFSPGLSVALVDGLPRRLEQPVLLSGGRLILPESLAVEVRRMAPPRGQRPGPKPVEPPASAKPFPPCTIVVDPGHGRGGKHHTGGKGATGLMEKDINLDVSMRLKRLLEAGGVKVIMTRTNEGHFSRDVDGDLQYRVDVAKKAAPDAFVSVHTNYAENTDARGYEIWVSREARGKRDRESRELAAVLRRELGTVIRSGDRGTKDERDLYVLNHTACTAVLVEMEFVSNPDAERLLASEAWRQRVAEALAEGLRKYVGSRR